MTVTLTLKPDIEAGLLVQAQSAGMTVEEYLLFMADYAVSREVIYEGASR